MNLTLNKFRSIFEANFETRRREKGQVAMPSSTIDDDYIKKTIALISKHSGQSEQEIRKHIDGRIKELGEKAGKSPVLFDTINKNAPEQTAFTMFWEQKIPVEGAPKFSNKIFRQLVQTLRVEYDEFFPLRSYVDKRRLITPVIKVIEPGQKDNMGIDTAAATPSGTFIFNQDFMQALINYAHLKGLKPKGKKYVSNGGKFPDEYAWIEFLIMHEFMHYSNDDFYYQKVIPKANNQIINWVGDFRTNYLLTKSGFEPLPIGLFSDDVNYDRQSQYIDMYNLVRKEFEKLAPPDQDWLKKLMDQLADEHSKGNAEAEESSAGDEATVDDLDDHAKENGESVDEANKSDETGPPAQNRSTEKQERNEEGKASKGKNPKRYEIDPSKIKPMFNWKTLVDRFLKSGMAKTEETYTKPPRRAITTMDIARQKGAAAIKPTERPQDFRDIKLMFIFDNSGSMSGDIAKVIANSKKLLRQPAFKNSTILTAKFSNQAELYKVNVARNVAAEIQEPTDQPRTWNLKADQIFGTSLGGGTYVSDQLVNVTVKAMKMGYNVIFCTDTDVLWGDNLANTTKMIQASPSQMFLILDSRDSYLSFRKKSGVNTANISHF